MNDCLTYLSLCGLLGYGYPRKSLEAALKEDLAFIGVDAGSTDPGPYYLGSGTSFVADSQVERDLEPALVAAVGNRIPLVVGTAGGSGARPHVDRFVDLLCRVARRNGLRCRLAVIHADVSHQVIADALASGRIEPCGPSGPLAPETIGGLCNPVAQMGTGPLVEALDNGADVVVCGRACDTAVFAALPIWRGHDPGLALHCAKIAECGTLCADPPGANDSVLCRLYADAFEVGPLNPARRCTPGSVAGHSLYEQPDPHCFHEPEGEIDLRGCRFEQVTDRAVRVRGSVLRPVSELWIKLESAELKGYRAVTIAGVSDPTAIREIDALQDGVRKAVAANLDGEVGEGEYRLVFRRYGLDAVALSPCEAERLPREGERLPGEIGLLIEVIAPSQDLADGILGLARATALHQSYEGRKTTAGNLAFPFSPSDLSGGPVYAFGLYHLMRVEGTEDLFPITYMDT